MNLYPEFAPQQDRFVELVGNAMARVFEYDGNCGKAFLLPICMLCRSPLLRISRTCLITLSSGWRSRGYPDAPTVASLSILVHGHARSSTGKASV